MKILFSPTDDGLLIPVLIPEDSPALGMESRAVSTITEALAMEMGLALGQFVADEGGFDAVSYRVDRNNEKSKTPSEEKPTSARSGEPDVSP